MSQRITIAHSPDADDAFMFYALASGKVHDPDFEFVHVLEDIQTLNERAFSGTYEVTAVSFHAYAHLADRYALLPHGASMGDGYGPILVSKRPIEPSALRECTIAVPGPLTSAVLAFRMWQSGLTEVVVPFDQIVDAVLAGRVDAGLIIHEAQVTYSKMGLQNIVDLGQWWKGQTGLPLPLGGNVIRKDLGTSAMRRISALLRESIHFGLTHRNEALTHAMQYGRDLTRQDADRFVGMYVNDWTLDYGDRGREAVRQLLARGREAGILPRLIVPEFAD